MNFRQIDDRYAVAGQIQAADVKTLKEAGYRTVICNRPDHEDPGQPTADAIRAAAAAEGMAFFHIPIASGQPITPADAERMRQVLAEAEGPVFAYCRSGARSTNIYGAAQSL